MFDGNFSQQNQSMFFMKTLSIKHFFVTALAVCLCLSMYAPGAHAQSGGGQVNASGIVVDEQGSPFGGASILVKGGTAGTISDIDGKFSFAVPNGSILQVAFVGYKTVEVPAATNMTIILEEDKEALEEVVVIGYGTVRKSDLTSSISTVSGTTIERNASTRINDVLQGRVAGLDIQADRYEGENRSMNIRGTRSLNASNTPLTIVDGVPASLSDVHIQDIASIEVMKDASSAAIYGSQGANGVIIVTTKRGSAGKTRVAYSGYTGISQYRHIDLVDGDRFVQMKRDAYLIANNMWTPGNKGTVDDSVLFTPDEMDVIRSGNYIDWFDLIYRQGSVQSHTVSVSGGTASTQFKMSAGYDRNLGYVKTNETNAFNISTSIDHRINEWIKVGTSIRFRNRRNGGFASYGQAIFYGTPVNKAYDADGNVIPIPNTNEGAYNVLLNYQDGQYINETLAQTMNALGYLDLKFAEGLTMHTNVGYNLSNSRNGYFYGANSYSAHGQNRSGMSRDYSYQLTVNNTISYTHKFADKHNLTVDLVQEIQKQESESVSASGRSEDVEAVTFYNLRTNTENKDIGSGYSGWSMASFMGRIRYDYLGKYLFNASVRSDGSSRLAEGHKWGTFLSAGAAWRISAEDFMSDAEWLSNLKLRVSYGEVGNQAIGVYQTLATLDSYPVLFGNTGIYAYRPGSLINKDLGWERSGTANIGLDFGVFKDRFTGSIDVYKTKTRDLLMRRSLPITIGYANIYDNIGSTENFGVELTMNASLIRQREMYFDLFGTFSYNTSKITQLTTDSDDISSGWFIGKPLSIIYDYEFIGIWQNDEAAEAAKYNCVPGDVKIKDQPGTSEGITADDKVFIGQRSPKYIASLGFNFGYKNFDFSATFSGRFGYLFNHDGYGYNLINGGNRWCADVDYWTPDNPSNRWPKASSDNANRGLCAYFSGNYIKLQDITVGYNISKFVNKTFGLNISSARFFLQARNFAYLYSAAGLHINPESTSVELSVPRTVNVGLNLNF